MLGVSVAATTIYTLLGYVNGAVLVAPMVALYTVAAQSGVRRAVAYGLGTLAVLGLASVAVNPLGPFGGGVEILPFMVAVVVVAGIAVANRRAYVDSIRDRAEQDARRRIDEERLRIARELHDVVAHTMATINVQAGVAAHVLSTRRRWPPTRCRRSRRRARRGSGSCVPSSACCARPTTPIPPSPLRASPSSRP